MNSYLNAITRPVILSGLILSLLGGCATGTEQVPVQVHAAPTSEGTGWSYRARDVRAEKILIGDTGAFDLYADRDLLAKAWSPLRADVTVKNHATSGYLLIRLNDYGTGRLNPLRGGPFSWELHRIEDAIHQTLPIIGDSNHPRYSVHLMAVEDDRRLVWESDAVAQVRLRRLASMLVTNGIDPRLITGQVWDQREEPEWKLAIVLRPYVYGDEAMARQLLAPGSF